MPSLPPRRRSDAAVAIEVSKVVAISRTLAAIDLVKGVELDDDVEVKEEDVEVIVGGDVIEDLFEAIGRVDDVEPSPSLNLTLLDVVELRKEDELKARPTRPPPPLAPPRGSSRRTPC